MMTDPRKACKNEEERLLWALIHDGIAHPLMAVTLYAWAPAIWFHDWTSQKAWPRPAKPASLWREQLSYGTYSEAEALRSRRKAKEAGWPVMLRSTPVGAGLIWYEVVTMHWDGNK